VTGLVNQELLLQNEYLAAENRILKTRLQPGWRLSDGERATLAEIGKRLGRKGLQPVARIALTQFKSIIIASAIIKGRGTFCYSLVLRRYRGAGGHRSSVASASGVSSSITNRRAA
jgi:hypothetical protein